MPFCERCEHYWAPSAMTPDGRCPDCGADLEAPARSGARRADLLEGAHRAEDTGGVDELDEADERDGMDGVDEKAPWHFKLLIVMLVVYLVWRGYDMILG